MNREFKKIALTGLYADPRVAEPMRLIAAHLTGAKLAVLATPDIATELSVMAINAEALPNEVDLIIAVGGDGTMLHAASMTGGIDVPLLGVNHGRLGFLTDVSPDQMLESLDQILGGNYTRESRLRLVSTLELSNGSQISALALNDIVLQRRDTGRMLDFETRIADRYVNTYMGDGLIVATPTGSTAYALSCGGPIIDPQLDAIVVVPICPHTLSVRPIVIPANQAIEVTLLERHDTSAEISVDGHAMGPFGPSDKLLITPSETRITLIHPPGYDYYEILRSKLHWGRDSRKRKFGDGE
ncbi:MAG: NAD(+) kinase [Proteobacteria bacterium]|nr:NAD(+) kinase [Pseudomonadota bacterium]MDA0993576.1 NAD(+) kinase [Pseudomonadota bacterium]